jgi:hypothetical protein
MGNARYEEMGAARREAEQLWRHLTGGKMVTLIGMSSSEHQQNTQPAPTADTVRLAELQKEVHRLHRQLAELHFRGNTPVSLPADACPR